VNSSGANTPPPSHGTGGSAFDNLVNSSNSQSSSSSAASFLAMMSSTSHSSSSSGFGSFSSAGSLSPAPGSGNLGFIVGAAINVTRLIDSQSETEITTDPSNPFRVMQQANDNGPLGRSIQSYSDNSFKKFRVGATFDNGDPTVAYDQFGNLWEGAIDTALNAIDLRGSSDNGRTFFFSTALVSPIPNTILSDQPRVRVGPSGVSTIPGAIWVEFTPFTTQGVPGVFAFGLADTGFGQAPQVVTFEQVGVAGANLDTIAIGPHGEASFASQQFATGNIFVATDLDGLGPQTPQFATVAAHSGVTIKEPIAPQAVRGINACPRLAYDRSTGPHSGRLYLSYTDIIVGTDDTNIFVTSSDTFGGSWSTPHRVNDDLTQNSQFFNNIAVDQTTGNIFVAWYDARNDLGRGGPGDTDHVPNTDVQIWGSVSRDGGLTWSKNQQISPGTSNGPSIGQFPGPGNGLNQFGDYIGVDFDEGRGWVSWTDNSSNPAGNFNRPLPDIVVASILINRGSGFTAIGDRFKDNGGNTTSNTAAPLILNPVDTEVDGLSIFPLSTTSTTPAPDWFKFVVPTTGIMTINMDITPAWPTEGQLGMRLYRPSSTGSLVQIGVSEIPGSATPQQITVPVVAGQVLFLYCHGITGGGIQGTGTFRLRFNIA
jgi:hypothetical protein